jgi:GMP synthase-like glutamine amidotransferase
MKPLVAIENEDIADLGIAEEVFRSEGVPVETVRAWKGEDLPSLDAVSGLVPLGGDMNVDQVDEHPYLAEEQALLADGVDQDVPVLGICLGGQLLARALGAPVHRANSPELGFTPLRLTEEGRRDPVLSALDDGDRMFQWHVDAFDLPVGTALLATGEDVPNQAFRAGRRAWGVQFHPEVSAQELDRWLDAVPHVERTYGRPIEELRDEIDRELDVMHERSRELFRRFARVLG